jgi:PGF-CTERM protein
MKLDDRTRKSGLVLTVFVVILMLIFAGPSSAVMVNLDMSDLDNKRVGQSGSFYFNVIIGGNERIPIADFTIDGLPHIDGSPSGTLLFNVGEVGITAGRSMSRGNYVIELVAIHGWVDGVAGYGYDLNKNTKPYYGYGPGDSFSGYGYGYGESDPSADQYTKLSYKITVDTTGATAGTYSSVTGKVNTDYPLKECFQSSTTSFILKPSGGNGGSSSGGSGTYPPGWDVTSTPASATGTATAAPPGERVTPRPTITKPTTTATETAAEGAAPKAPKKGLPGFTAVFAIAGLLAIAYLVMRRRE